MPFLLFKVHVGQLVHQRCRRDFCRHKENSDASGDKNSNVPESLGDAGISECCFFCGCAVNSKKRGCEVNSVKNLYFLENVAGSILNRNDEWAHQVKKRMEGKDLINTKYHKNCSINFQNHKSIPLCHGISVSKKIGRPQNESAEEAVSAVVSLVQSERGRIFSMTELTETANRECGDQKVDNRYLKKKLLERFGEEITVISNDGKSDLLILR